MQVPVTIYAESTPNPDAMKFVSNMLFLEDGIVEFASAEEVQGCPLATQLFSFTGVKSIFITSNFITITKVSNIDWFEITGILREFIRGYLSTGEKIFSANPHKAVEKSAMKTESGELLKDAPAPAENNTDLDQKIIQMLEDYVKPAVEQDGGAIHFRSFNNGVVTVALKGSCSGCPSSTLTLKSGIENLLKQMIPQVTEVVAESE